MRTNCSLRSGGLRDAATTGYYLTAFQAETHPLPRGGTDFMGTEPTSQVLGGLTNALSGSPHLTTQRTDFFDFNFHFIAVF